MNILLRIVSLILAALALVTGTWSKSQKTAPIEETTLTDAAMKTAQNVEDEGIVLLKNDNDILPLGNKKVNLFGTLSAKPLLSGGSGGGVTNARAADLYDGLNYAGISYNKELKNLFYNFAYDGIASLKEYEREEPSVAEDSYPFLTAMLSSALAGDREELKASKISDSVTENAVAFSDTAVYIIGNYGGTGNDLEPEDLRLSSAQKEMLNFLNGNFKHIILLLNSSNPFELGFIDEYKNIDAVLWIGLPGQTGFLSVGSVLKGNVNPSGRLADTYVYDNNSAPAAENFDEYDYSNVLSRAYLNYEENIYVGYRYYETFLSEKEYAAQVIYPFGYGLSYTDFSRRLLSYSFADGKVTVSVKVTNVGDYAGKDVVELYYAPPFTGKAEKAKKNLAAYTKTNTIKPGKSETVTCSFKIDDMASWISEYGCYALEAGKYTIYVSSDAHNSDFTLTYTLEAQRKITTDPKTGKAYSNLFSQAQGSLKYFSRSDPEGTYPTDKDNNSIMPDSVKAYMKTENEVKKTEGEVPTTGKKGSVVLSDLVGLDYDDPLWDEFLDRFTVDEMTKFVTHCTTGTKSFERLGISSTLMADGPSGFGTFLESWSSVIFPCEVVIASTWNESLTEKTGACLGAQAEYYGVDVIWGPGVNIHRTAFGGRNFEYFSEDPLLTGKCAATYIRGAQSEGTLCTIKHFALNDQEMYRCYNGLYVWSTEQALREIYFKPFELAVKKADCHAVMSSFIRVGAEWSGSSKALLTDLLRGEWGFQGFVMTDNLMTEMPRYTVASSALAAGNDLMIEAIMPDVSQAELKAAVIKEPVGMTTALRNACHNICYAYAAVK